nr:MAG TPA: hypothetical protein [Bacteriophage sp.]
MIYKLFNFQSTSENFPVHIPADTQYSSVSGSYLFTVFYHMAIPYASFFRKLYLNVFHAMIE